MNNNSGLLHLTCGLVMAQMTLNCWTDEKFEPFIKGVSFLQLTASNLVAITNLAICVNLALIVHVSLLRGYAYVEMNTRVTVSEMCSESCSPGELYRRLQTSVEKQTL